MSRIVRASLLLSMFICFCSINPAWVLGPPAYSATAHGTPVNIHAAISAIRQPASKLGPVYKKQPCLTTKQAGTTSHKCTNN